mmetsp:Transcript_38023/g.122270  ORF Transcript_38023/g.122270 Transcript_38023/m.122270 type:complete len:208 (-) Transcript_38023:820-1443(-)
MRSASTCGEASNEAASMTSSRSSSLMLSKRPSVASTSTSPSRTGTRTMEASCGVSKRGSGASPESGARPSWNGVLNARSCCGDRKAICILRFPARASSVPSAAEAFAPTRRSNKKPESPTLTARSSALCASSEARQTVEDPTTPDSCILCHASCSTVVGSSSFSRFICWHELRDAYISAREYADGSMSSSHHDPTPSATPIMCGPSR